MDRNEYLEIVSAQVRCKRAVPYLREELEDHIQDQKEDYMAEGMNPYEAEMMAVREMGDPVETGVQLDQVHRPRMEWRVLLGAILLGIIGFVIQMSILSVTNPEYRIQELMDQVIVLAVGMGIMLIVCYIDYSIMLKYARLLWWSLLLLLFLSCIGIHPILYRVINGVNRTNWIIAYFICPVYPAFVYSWRNQGRKGFLMSLSGLVLSAVLLASDLPLGWVAKFSLINVIVFGYAIYKKWFQITRADVKALAKYGICTLGGIIFCVICEIIEYGFFDFGLYNFNYIPQYYVERFRLFLSGNVTDYIAEEIKVYLQNGGNVAESQFLQEYLQNDYIWLFITTYFGKPVGIFIAALFVIFIFFLIRKVIEQKNMLGKFIAFSCTLLLTIEIIFYVGGNLGWTPFLGCFMPFLGDGKVVTMITYFYIGILMSIFRNTNVVRN